LDLHTPPISELQYKSSHQQEKMEPYHILIVLKGHGKQLSHESKHSIPKLDPILWALEWWESQRLNDLWDKANVMITSRLIISVFLEKRRRYVMEIPR